MTVGTQVDSDLSFTESSCLALLQGTYENPGLCREIDPTNSMDDAVNQIYAQLQLTRDSVSGGEGLAPLSDEKMVAFEQLVLKVGLENIPYLQPKELPHAGDRKLVQALNGVQIRLVPMQDLESDISVMDTSHDSLPTGYSSTDPLGLNLGEPSDL